MYEKQNIHALVEFKEIGSSMSVKDALDGKKWNNLFLVRVQYTKKKSLSINPNSPLEYEKNENQSPLYKPDRSPHQVGFIGPNSSNPSKPTL